MMSKKIFKYYGKKAAVLLACISLLGQASVVYAATASIYDTGAENYSHLSWGADVINSTDLCDKLLEKYGDISNMPEITVGIIDSGIDYRHSFFQNRIKSYQYDFVDCDGDAMDENGHGTHIAGIIADVTLPNVKLNAYRVANAKGEAYLFAVAQGIHQAIKDKVDIINISLGAELLENSIEAKLLKEALDEAIKHDIIIVAAAGNGNDEQMGIDVGNIWPACYPNVVTISAIDQNYCITSFSNYGKVINFCAPGIDIYSTALDDNFIYMTGTSMATPFVVGAAALLLTDEPTMSSDQVIEGLKNTAIDLGEEGFDEYYGYGLVNLKNWELHLNQIAEAQMESKIQIPGMLKLKKVVNTASGIKLKWEKTSNTKGYYVYRKTSNSNGYKKIKTITGSNTTSFIDKNAKEGKSYWYKVLPFNEEGKGKCVKAVKIVRRKS